MDLYEAGRNSMSTPAEPQAEASQNRRPALGNWANIRDRLAKGNSSREIFYCLFFRSNTAASAGSGVRKFDYKQKRLEESLEFACTTSSKTAFALVTNARAEFTADDRDRELSGPRKDEKRKLLNGSTPTELQTRTERPVTRHGDSDDAISRERTTKVKINKYPYFARETTTDASTRRRAVHD
ncbi:hypothetical protein EVAR_18885_1 [Eumeta japonica]|uniref:Uncharacterized protein n=1 Tax=Eumeta variegata TaxID=151549 RepID=A0A4C1V1S0_EUMVA|nr:hypothetical protein EVAR_18885_1 [Eumeta japonica]